MPRIVYSMANDQLIFKFLGRVLKKFKTPYIASLVTGLIAGLILGNKYLEIININIGIFSRYFSCNLRLGTFSWNVINRYINGLYDGFNMRTNTSVNIKKLNLKNVS